MTVAARLEQNRTTSVPHDGGWQRAPRFDARILRLPARHADLSKLPAGPALPNAARPAVARIYRPARSAMQSGRASAKHWILEFEPAVPPEIEPLMGWTAARDTMQQVRLKFPTADSAVAFARRQGWTFEVCAGQAVHGAG
jgi:hypothetical protein